MKSEPSGFILHPSAFILERLERPTCSSSPWMRNGRWYRYHHLFGDLLLARLQAENPGRTRSSTGAPRTGTKRTAILAWRWNTRSRPRICAHAADLIERHITERWQTVDLEFLLLVNRLPMEVLAQRPALCLQSAWLCVMIGQTERILPFVDAAERCLLDRGATREPAIRPAGPLPARCAGTWPISTTSRWSWTPPWKGLCRHPGGEHRDAQQRGDRDRHHLLHGRRFRRAMRCYEDALERDKRVNGTNAVPIATMRMVWFWRRRGGCARRSLF